MEEVINGQGRNGEDSTNMCDIFERRRALRRAQSSGYDPSKKSESLFGRRIDDFKHFMHKDDLKKLYPNAVSASPKPTFGKLSTACPSDDTGLYMNVTAEPTPSTSINNLTQRSNSLPASNCSDQFMDLSGFESGSSPTAGKFNISNENIFFRTEGTISCAAPVSQTPSVHSMFGKGAELDLASDFTVLKEKLMPHQSTFGLADQESAVLDSKNVIHNVPSSHITTTHLDTDKPAEEPVESPIKESKLRILRQNYPSKKNGKLKVSYTPEVELGTPSVLSSRSKEERNERFVVAEGINKYPISTNAAAPKDPTGGCLCVIC